MLTPWPGAVRKARTPAGCPVRVRGHDDEKRIRGHGDERLGSLRVSLDQCQRQRKRARLGAKDADPGPAVRAEVEPGPVVEPLAQPLVDDPIRRSGGLEHVAEGGELRQR